MSMKLRIITILLAGMSSVYGVFPGPETPHSPEKSLEGCSAESPRGSVVSASSVRTEGSPKSFLERLRSTLSESVTAEAWTPSENSSVAGTSCTVQSPWIEQRKHYGNRTNRIDRGIITNLDDRVQEWFDNPDKAFAGQGYCTRGHIKCLKANTPEIKNRIIEAHRFPRIIDMLLSSEYCYESSKKERRYRLYGEIRTCFGEIKKGSFTYAVVNKINRCYHRSFSEKDRVPEGLSDLPDVDKRALERLTERCDFELYDLEVAAKSIKITDKETGTAYSIYFYRSRN